MTTKPKTKAKATPDIDFEKAMAELESLVEKMESGDLSLEASLKAFEDGVKLTRDCQAKLAAAEQRVNQLVEQQGELVSVAFDEDELEE